MCQLLRMIPTMQIEIPKESLIIELIGRVTCCLAVAQLEGKSEREREYWIAGALQEATKLEQLLHAEQPTRE